MAHLDEKGLNKYTERLTQAYLNQINQNKTDLASLQSRVEQLEEQVQTLQGQLSG